MICQEINCLTCLESLFVLLIVDQHFDFIRSNHMAAKWIYYREVNGNLNQMKMLPLPWRYHQCLESSIDVSYQSHHYTQKIYISTNWTKVCQLEIMTQPACQHHWKDQFYSQVVFLSSGLFTSLFLHQLFCKLSGMSCIKTKQGISILLQWGKSMRVIVLYIIIDTRQKANSLVQQC